MINSQISEDLEIPRTECISSMLSLFIGHDIPRRNIYAQIFGHKSELCNFKLWYMINHLGRKYRFLFIILFGFLGTGCGALLSDTDHLPIHQQAKPLPQGPICRVAVLPFLNESDFPLGDAIFSKVFASQLQDSTNYFVIQEGDILKTYQQLHILPGEAPTLQQLHIIADRVNAQLLITGSVIEMRTQPAPNNTVNPMITVEIEILDGRSDRSLWTTLHKRDGFYYQKTMHFGIIHTITGLSKQMAVEIINLWHKKGLTQCYASPQS